jgi:hypothetical protein
VPDRPPPRARLELRIDGDPLAWYYPDDLDEATRHANAVVTHPDARAVVQVVHVQPGASDAVLVTTMPRNATPDSRRRETGAA